MHWVVGTWLACSGGPTDGVVARTADAGPTLPVTGEQLDATWVLQVVPEAAVAPFASEPGWVSLVMKRDVKTAVQQLGPRGGVAAARAHLEAAALFRQAARLAAESYVQAYGRTPKPTDPVGTAHLVSIGEAIRGDLAAARSASGTARSLTDDPTQPWHAPWAHWLDGEATWPPDLTALPLTLPPPTPGTWPDGPTEPQYALVERSEKRSRRTLGDPGVLLAFAQWHEATALVAAPDARDAILRARAGYRLPLDRRSADAASTPLPLAFLFGSDHLVSGDVDFLAALPGGEPRSLIQDHAPTSVIAAMARPAVRDDGFEASTASDLARALRQALVDRAAQARAGSANAQDVQFATLAQVGALRSLALVAEALGDREASGRLQIAARDAGDGATACPVGLVSFAAWDAANRFTVRGAETIYEQSQIVPELVVARYAVDVLNLRINFDQLAPPPN